MLFRSKMNITVFFQNFIMMIRLRGQKYRSEVERAETHWGKNEQKRSKRKRRKTRSRMSGPCSISRKIFRY